MTEKETSRPAETGRVELNEQETETVAAGGEAVFDNFVGFYQIADTDGGIDRPQADFEIQQPTAGRLGHTMRKL